MVYLNFCKKFMCIACVRFKLTYLLCRWQFKILIRNAIRRFVVSRALLLKLQQKLQKHYVHVLKGIFWRGEAFNFTFKKTEIWIKNCEFKVLTYPSIWHLGQKMRNYSAICIYGVPYVFKGVTVNTCLPMYLFEDYHFKMVSVSTFKVMFFNIFSLQISFKC